MKKFLILVLAAAMAFVAVACAKPEDSEVLAEYRALYEKAQEINGIVYGNGLPNGYEGDASKLKSPHYVAVAESCPYKSLEDIEAAVLSVYTEDYYNDVLKNVLFDGIEDKYATVHPRYKMQDGVLMTDVTYDAFESITGARNDLDSAYVIRSSSGTAEVGAPRYVNDVKQEADKKTTMIMTENGWRFDNLA